MASDLVARVAGESEESRTQREQFKRQIEILKNGLETCKRFVGVGILDSALVPGWNFTEDSLTESDDDDDVDDDDASTTHQEVRSLSSLSPKASPRLMGKLMTSEPVPVEVPERRW